ncbi:MAG TPA: metallophosphoesterase, partial [Accumulibacter sp.]|nr:metallophosphoesterase [Accumulibacter sp.]
MRVPLDAVPIEITLGLNDRRLHLYRENRLDREGKPVWLESFIIVDPRTYMRRISGFVRLSPKSWLALGSSDELQKVIFDYPAAIDEQHMVLIYGRDELIFRNLSDAGTAIAPVIDNVGLSRIGRLRRLREIIGGPIELLPRDDALRLIEQVNRLMRSEAYRSTDERGLPGGLIALPRSMTPVIVADLHAQVDNLLTVLAQNAFLDALEEGCAALVILGDAVHCEL